MKFSPVPAYIFRKITEISPDFLERLGVRFLMFDLDNTVAPYKESLPSNDVITWVELIKRSGVALFIVSNSRRVGRVGAFSEALGVAFTTKAGKPSPGALHRVMAQMSYSAGECALVGDQIYTDILAANRAGVISIAVRPLRLHNPLIAARYASEALFRALCKEHVFL